MSLRNDGKVVHLWCTSDASLVVENSGVWCICFVRTKCFRLQIRAYFRLAQLLLTALSGSVEDERVFSGFECVTHSGRNRLKNEHVEACLQLTVQTISTF